MKKLTAHISLFLCIALIFSACGKTEQNSNNTYDLSGEDTSSQAPVSNRDDSAGSEGSDAAEEAENTDVNVEADQEAEKSEPVLVDYDTILAKHDPDELVYSCCGYDVSWKEYSTWVYSYYTVLSNYFSRMGMDEIDWDMEIEDGISFSEFGKMYIESTLNQYYIVRYETEKLGFAYDDEIVEFAENLIREDADNYYGGDVDALKADIKSQHSNPYMTDEFITMIYGVGELYLRAFESIFGKDGANVTEAEIRAYMKDNDVLNAKHILVSTMGDDGLPLEEEKAAQKKALAEEILSLLKPLAGDTLAAKFDELIDEYSEDPGCKTYPDGYFFSAGEMVAPFEEAARLLEEGQISGIVETDYGYHILYRPRLNINAFFCYDQAYREKTLIQYVANELYGELQRSWGAGQEVIYSDAFVSVSISDLIF